MRNQTNKPAGQKEIDSRYYENTKENHNKFYEIAITQSGSTYLVTAYWGRISNEWEAKENSHEKYRGTDKAKAEDTFWKIATAKERKGYELQGTTVS